MIIEEWSLEVYAMLSSVAPEVAMTVFSSGSRKVFRGPAVDNQVRLKERV